MIQQGETSARAPRNFAARKARKENTRKKLVEVAIDMIRKDGFSHLRIDALAEQAGTNRTTFYLHFRNKDDLVVDIAEQVRADAQAAFEKLDLAALTLDSVESWITAVEDVYSRHSRLIDAMQAALAATRASAAIFDGIANSYIEGLTGRFPVNHREHLRIRMMAAYLLVERFMFYSVIREHPLGGAGMRRDLAAIVFDILRRQ